MSTGNTAKEAAIRLLLGETGELIEKVEKASAALESASTTLRESHNFIEADLERLGAMVTRLEQSISNTMDHTTYLLDQAKAAPSPAAAKLQQGKAKFPVAAIVVSAVLAAALSTAGVAALIFGTIDDARVGRAVSSALPYLEPGVKQKLEAAMQKASSK